MSLFPTAVAFKWKCCKISL